MYIQLIRHATMLIMINERKILVDPMLSPAEMMSAVPDVPNKSDNPLVDLPVELDDLINVDAVLITHTHRDHFDSAAIELLSKDTLMFCQPADAGKISEYGFTNIKPIAHSYAWNGLNMHRTSGQHGVGEIGHKMGPVAGFVLETAGEPSLYIAGDTIFCAEVEESLDKYQPQITICFAGAARFSHGGPITMDKDDIVRLAKKAPYTKIIVAHMEAWNHCSLSRQELKTHIQTSKLAEQIMVPGDGEIIGLA